MVHMEQGTKDSALTLASIPLLTITIARYMQQTVCSKQGNACKVTPPATCLCCKEAHCKDAPRATEEMHGSGIYWIIDS